MKIEKNEFFEGEFPAFENRNVWIEREHIRLIEVTPSLAARRPDTHDTWIRTLHSKNYQALSFVISRERKRHEKALLGP